MSGFRSLPHQALDLVVALQNRATRSAMDGDTPLTDRILMLRDRAQRRYRRRFRADQSSAAQSSQALST
jgi:hypothetical protein